MLQVVVNVNDMEWQPAEAYPKGTLWKVLRDDHGRKTVLLKLQPGFKMEPHTHTCMEQHFILEGSYEIDGQTYAEGTYQLIPPNFTHGPFYSKNGAVLLVAWDAIPEHEAKVKPEISYE